MRAAALNQVLAAEGLPPVEKGASAAELLRRPELTYELVCRVIGPGQGSTRALAGALPPRSATPATSSVSSAPSKRCAAWSAPSSRRILTMRPLPASGWKRGKSWPGCAP